jgi:hypothetical protein
MSWTGLLDMLSDWDVDWIIGCCVTGQFEVWAGIGLDWDG